MGAQRTRGSSANPICPFVAWFDWRILVFSLSLHLRIWSVARSATRRSRNHVEIVALKRTRNAARDQVVLASRALSCEPHLVLARGLLCRQIRPLFFCSMIMLTLCGM